MRSFSNSDEGVSSAASSLLLIMITAGGIAVLSALIQDVSSQTDSILDNSIEITSIKINIFGSEFVKPAVDAQALVYNDRTPGIIIQTQGSGSLEITSESGIAGAGEGIIDIGTADRKPTPAELEKYPGLNLYKLGTSAIVVIVNKGTDPDPVELVKNGKTNGTFLNGLYKGSIGQLWFYNESGNHTSRIQYIKAYQMAGSPPTEKAFLQYIGLAQINSTIPEVSGNAGMLEAVKNTPKSVGFIEYGYVDTAEERGQHVHIAGLWNEYNKIKYNNSYFKVSNFTLAAASNNVNNSYYPLELAHPLYFVTNGKPSSLADSFIKWAKSYEGQNIVEKAGYISYLREIEQ